MVARLHLYNITLMLNRGREKRRLTSSSHAAAVRSVMEHVAKKQARVFAWMVMPDHIHLLFGRMRALKDVERFAGRIKRQINSALQHRGLPKMHWLHGCKRYAVAHHELARARDYILDNPVRGQMVKRAEDYAMSDTPAPLSAEEADHEEE